MTVRPRTNSNLNPTSLKKSYGPTTEQIDQWLATWRFHPCFEDVGVLDALRILKGDNPSVRVLLQLEDYREQEQEQ